MPNGDAMPYRVLILDDKVGKSSWGAIGSIELEEHEFVSTHVSNWEEATETLQSTHYDIIIVDLDLDSPKNGLDFLAYLRSTNRSQPVVLVTGNQGYLERPIYTYRDAFALGPVSFFSKLSDANLVEVVREAALRVDPVRRSLAIMKEAGLGSVTFTVDDEEYTVDDLLVPGEKTDLLMQALRESLQALLLETVKGEPQ